MRFFLFVAGIVWIGLLMSCQKTPYSDLGATLTTPPPATQIDLLKDSVFLYSKEVYLWTEVIPDYQKFNPRGYSGSTDLEAAENVMDGIRALQPLDRFSFVTTEEEAAGIQTGEDKDYGFFIKAAATDLVPPLEPDSTYWFVSYVYKSSPAGNAGVQRGWKISKINGTSITYSNSSITLLNQVFFGTMNNALIQFTKSDGVDVSVNLTKGSFVANSVLHRSILTSGSTKVGYLVFNAFFGQPSRIELGEAFTYFQSQGINELVVDLRYNGGGSVQTQDTLANLIAPQSANGKIMYKTIYNKTLQQNKHQLIRKKLGYGSGFEEANNTEVFKKAGNLNLSRAFFIVTGSSASASELLINNLKPYMNVKLIGDTTYGKPVGFFGIPIYKYVAYPISFKTVNSAGNADYYTGFVPDALVPDGVNKAWGDPSEPCLASAIKYILTGSFRLASVSTNEFAMRMSSDQQLQAVQKSIESKKFIGMFNER
ncbi:MAG: S41 family peptidase [Chitinophagaceae bacterium]